MLPAVNGQDNPQKVKKLVNNLHNGKGPYYIAEWYPAWFDCWGTTHHTVPAEKYTGRLDSVLAAGISINMSMFHGGTTRGFMNGANLNDISPYAPQISSYDYDAPLDEAGNATDKFIKFRQVIEKHLPEGVILPPIPAPKPVIEIPAFNLAQSVSLFEVLPKAIQNRKPLTFEDLSQDYGYVLYRSRLRGGHQGILKIKDLRDYGIIFINGKRVGILDRRLNQDSLQISLPKGDVQLDILVENMGRINFGKYMLQNKKGITEKVFFGGKEISDWKMYGFPFDRINMINTLAKKTTSNRDIPALKKGSFNLSKRADTYLDMRKWGKGVVWVNGHNLGRYWSIGPQQTLYLPAEWLEKGKNEIVVLELLETGQNSIQGFKAPILDQLKK